MIFYINYTFLPLCLLADLFLEFGQETCLNTRQQTMMIQTVTKPRTPAPMIIHMPPPNIDPLFLLSSFKSRKNVRENEVPGQTSKYMYIKIRHGRGEQDFQKLK